MTKNKHWKHPQYGHVYANDNVPTPIGRLSWPSLVTPKAPPPPKEGQAAGSPRYEVTILLAKEDAETDSFVASLDVLKKEMLDIFNDGRGAKIGDCKTVTDGDTFDHEKYPYYKGEWVLVARISKNEFLCVDSQDPPQPYPKDKILGGMLGKLLVTPIVTAHGMSFKLDVVQFIKDDGVRYGANSRTPESLLNKLGSAPKEIEEEGAGVLQVSPAPVEDVSQAEKLRAQVASKMKAPPLKGKAMALNTL